MTEQKIDNGNEVVTANVEATDNRHIANGKAKQIVDAIMKSETALAITAKDWGSALFRAVISDGASLDMLIGESKLSAGFTTLGTSEAGAKAKNRLNVYFSNARLVMERYSSLSDEAKEAILDGTSSIHYLASQFRDADRKALAASKKAEKEAEAAANPDAANGTNVPTITDLANELLERWNAATEDERNEGYDAIAALVDKVNADVEAATEVEAETPQTEVKAA